jgi:DNA-binding transcriptional regulator YdaS (Cro superfamily)
LALQFAHSSEVILGGAVIDHDIRQRIDWHQYLEKLKPGAQFGKTFAAASPNTDNASGIKLAEISVTER